MNYTITETAKSGNVTLYEIKYKTFTAQASTTLLPQSDILILTVICKRGLLLCRLYENAVAERLGAAAAVFSAATLDDLLKKTPLSLTAQAAEMGATLEMTGLELIEQLS